MDKTIDIERLLKDVPEEALPWAYAYIAFLCAKPDPKWTDSDAAISVTNEKYHKETKDDRR